MPTSNNYHLSRFIDAQAAVYQDVVRELKGGRKVSHWMWFIFPQIKGLGASAMAQHYAIGSLAEARAYLENPVLGERLDESTQCVNRIEGRSVHQIFGTPDDLKFRSSMTLFAEASGNAGPYTKALEIYFDGEWDRRTLELLASRTG